MKKTSLIKRILIGKIGRFFAKHPFAAIMIWILYLVMPVDLFPEALTGVFGYLDDFLALAVLTMLLNKARNDSADSEAPPSQAKAPDPYSILGVNASATEEELTRAYRKKMSEYHPDKVHHLGADLRKLALQKSQEIQAAYAILSKRHKGNR